MIGRRMNKPYSIKIFLPGGDPEGVRTIEKFVHGEQCDTSTKDAVLMRYVASCVVFNCAGLARAMGRLDDDAGAKSVIRALDQDNYGQSLMPGVTRSSYLLRILSEGYRFASRG